MSTLPRPEIEATYQARLTKEAQSRNVMYCQYFDRLEVSVAEGWKDTDVIWEEGISVEKLDLCLEVRCRSWVFEGW